MLIKFPPSLSRLPDGIRVRLETDRPGSDFLVVVLDRLVGLVVKASASRAEGPGFEFRLRRNFFGVESYQ